MYSLYRSISESEKQSLSPWVLCISDWCLVYYFLVEGLMCNACTVLITSSIPTGHIRVFDSIHMTYNQSNMLHCSFQEKQDKNWYYGCLQAKRNQWLWTLCFSKCYCVMWRGTTTVEGLRPRRYGTHLQECLKNCTPYPFPSNHRDMHHDDIKKTKLVSLHCTCWLPEHPNKRMIQCINCEVWYHDDCEVVEPKAWKDEDYPWKCRKCINRSETS